MNRIGLALVVAGCASACGSMASRDAAAPRPRAAETLDGAAIEQATGLKGAFDAAHAVFKVTAPRTDVAVLVDGRALEPFLGLTSWAGFLPGTKAPCMVMGDLVLFQDEVNPVMSAALDHGLTVTALHNHFFDDEPRVYFMHIGGEGTQDALARGVRAALDQVRHVRGGHPTPGLGSRSTGVPSKSAIPADKIDAILATKGTVKDGMYKAVFGREVGLPCGCSVGKDMGVNTWVAMGGDAEHALVDGDFLTFEGELQPVLKALRHAGIDIVAIHSHMEGEAPKALFLHYWGVGRAEDLAHGVKSALDLLGR